MESLYTLQHAFIFYKLVFVAEKEVKKYKEMREVGGNRM